MPEFLSLVKANPLLPAEDFLAMRRQGIKSIERLSSDTWTDYNLSDPGITILEAVCYAITDLSYRTGFDVKDILAQQEPDEDAWKDVFYTARQILHNSALTATDYRKLILDVAGVRNAWITPSKDYEVPLWIDYKKAERRTEEGCSCDDADDKICIGKLSLYPWDETAGGNEKLLAELQADLVKLNKGKAKLQEILKNAKDAAPLADAQAKLTNTEAKIAELNDKITQVQSVRSDIPSKIVELEGLLNVTIEYEEDILEEAHREDVRQQVIERLQGHRNLCEDFLSVNAAEYLDFGIGASFELEEAADADKVLAQIFFIIYKYFTPSVPFCTIEQLMKRGMSVDEIFEGPALRNGFIVTEDLDATELFRDIRLSDIISEISDIPGLKAILFLRLPFLGFDQKDERNSFFNEWVRFLTEERKIARIQPSMSSVMFCKEAEFITYNVNAATDRRPDRMQKLFYDAKALERKYRLKGTALDFPVPEGEYKDLQDFYPVTYTLPDCYGVKKGVLPEDATAERKAQALQLKGYLLFFEQIMSDYLVQLDSLRSLFSFKDSGKSTRFTKVLRDLDGIRELLPDHGHANHHGPNHEGQVYHDFKEVLENLTETPEQFAVRRNRFLNHMLARFSEDMSEYEEIMTGLFPYKAAERLVGDKVRVLQGGEYFQISTDRAQGYNYTKMDTWDTLNVSGTERRVSRLLGFSQATRRSLTPEYIIIETWLPGGQEKGFLNKGDSEKKYNTIRIVDPQDRERTLLTSVRVKDGCCTEDLLMAILEHAGERRYFIFHDERKPLSRKTAGIVGNFWFELVDDTNPMVAVSLAASEKFKNREERDKAFHRLQAVIIMMDDNEGLHLVEHLLLRPKMDKILDEDGIPVDVALLNICLDDCDLNKGLDEGTDVPPYRKKISRTPAEKCYDQMPWVLEYLRMKPLESGGATNRSMLFAETFPADEKEKDPVPLKFRKYEALTRRVRDLQEFGSERVNYQIVRNGEEDDLSKVKWSFIIRGEGGEHLAQSPFIFNKKTKAHPTVQDDIEVEIQSLIRYFGFELDLYCGEDPCDHNEDPYSFRSTAVLPCWPRRFRNPTFRHLVEKTIQSESPAHVHVRVVWVGIGEMRRFEDAYAGWLVEMAQTEAPVYDAVNPLVDVLNTLKPCGHCDDDCGEPADSKRPLPKDPEPEKKDVPVDDTSKKL